MEEIKNGVRMKCAGCGRELRETEEIISDFGLRWCLVCSGKNREAERVFNINHPELNP